jgi:hypothetical protein
MGIVGFNFLKIVSERNVKGFKGNIEIKHNIAIKDVEKTNLKIGTKNNDVLRIIFDFSINYGENFGKIELIGEVIYSDTKEIIEETKKGWDSEKKINNIINSEILKFVYNKVIIKSLDLADLLNLPLPVPMPKINVGKPNKK